MTEACNLAVLKNSIMEGGCPLKGPPTGAVLSPWVQIKFQVSGMEITVGNKSCPQKNHHAVIKDFEFGHSEGVECRVTIVDEQGSSFVKLMEDLLKNPSCTARNTNMVVDLGWIMENCPSGFALIKNPTSYHIIAENIECNFSGGKFHFMIVGKDLGSTMWDYKHEQHYGDEKNKMTLVDAITKMLTTGTPSVSSVKFQRYDDANNPQDIIFKETGDKLGRKAVWYSLSTDKLNCALNWLKDNITNQDKTVVPTYNSEVPGGEIIFWEDFKPNCGQSRNWEQNCLGTYVVNGGKMSNVLEFNPRIKWSFFTLQTGGNVGYGQPLSNEDGGKTKGRTDCRTISRAAVEDAGASQTHPPNHNTVNVHGEKAADVASKGQTLQQKGMNFFTEPITADLVLVGDPTILRPAQAIKQKNVKIIFLNPFYIMEGSNACGEWLAQPPCNEVLTNKAWIIQSITHRISEGRFTTTIGVYLTAPGVDIEVGEPLGGSGSGGWVPPPGC